MDGISIYDGGTYWHFVSFGLTEIYQKETDDKELSGFDAFQKSNLTGFITIDDPTVNAIDTPNGKVEFRELIGMTDAELKTLSTIQTVMDIYAELGSDVTDYNRKSLR